MESDKKTEELVILLKNEQKKVSDLIEEKKDLQEIIESQKKTIDTKTELYNTLQKEFSILKEQNYKLATEVDQEEEAITNNLQRRLSDLMKSKVELEKQLEYEQEFFVNRLQKQIKIIENERNTLKDKLECDTESLIHSISSGIDLLKKITSDPCYTGDKTSVGTEHEPLPKFLTQLIEDTKILSIRLKDLEKEKQASVDMNNQLKLDIKKMNDENFILQQKLNAGNKKIEEAWKMVGEIERSYETISENEFNHLDNKPPSPDSMLSRIRSASIESRERSASLTNRF